MIPPGQAPCPTAPVPDAILAPAGSPARQTQLQGIALLLVAILLFTLMDATAKHLAAHYHPVQIVWARFVINLAIVGLVVAPHLGHSLRSARPGVQLCRALAQLGSSALFITSLHHIGLAEATAIMDINPVLITLGAAIFLGESIGLRRAAGIAAALCGALIIIRPGAAVFDPAAMLPLMAAFTYAAGALLTRLARGDSTATSVLWSALVGSAISSLAVPFFWQPVAIGDLWAFVLLGLLGTVAQALLIRAFALAEAAAIAPFGYTGLIWAGLWGWLFWGTVPDRWTVIGALIIVAAGLYVWMREARAMHRIRRTD